MILSISLYSLIILLLFYSAKSIKNSILSIITCIFILDFLVKRISPENAGVFTTFITFLSIFTILVHLRKILNNPVSKQFLRFFIFYSIGFSIFLIILAIIHGNNILSYFMIFRNHFRFYVVFLLLVSYVGIRDKISEVMTSFRFLFLLFVFFIVLGFFQYFFSSMSNNIFIIDKEMFNFSIYGKKLIVGTLYRPANFGHTIVILTIFFSFYYNLGLLKVKYEKYVLIFSFILVLFIGVRTSLLTLLIGMTLLLYMTNKKKLIVYVLFGSALFLAFQNYITSTAEESINTGFHFYDPIKRNFAIFSFIQEFFTYGFKGNIHTGERSVSMIPYVLESPFFGLGSFENPHLFYGISSWTDATMMFYAANFGLPFLLYLLLPFLYIAFIMFKRQDYFIILLLTIIIMQTFTDQGLFGTYGSFLFFMISGFAYNIYYQKNDSTLGQ